MSKLTETSRLKVEDFNKQREWIGPLLESYNNFLTQAIRLFNNGLSFVDNVIGLENEFAFTFQSQALSFPQRVKWPYDRIRPKHLFLTYASEEGASIILLHSWRFTDDRFIEITSAYKIDTSGPSVANLTVGSDYLLRIRVEP